MMLDSDIDNYSTGKQPKTNAGAFLLLPVAGIALFAILYYCAALLYPGGSQADVNAVGFSWVNNYWCNLLDKTSMNGKPNPGRPIAISAMLIVCISLSLFWYLFPAFINFGKPARIIIRTSGMLAMFVALFLVMDYHSLGIYVSSGLGLIALGGTYIGLLRLRWYFLFWFGILNFFILAADHYIYYTKDFVAYLPVIQKINFASFLLWIGWITVKLYGSRQTYHRES